MPGHGNSEGQCIKSIEEMSIWINKVIETWRFKQITIMGHSQGCLIALEYALINILKIKKFNICSWFI